MGVLVGDGDRGLSSLLLLNTMPAASLHVGIGGSFRVGVGVVNEGRDWR